MNSPMKCPTFACISVHSVAVASAVVALSGWCPFAVLLLLLLLPLVVNGIVTAWPASQSESGLYCYCYAIQTALSRVRQIDGVRYWHSLLQIVATQALESPNPTACFFSARTCLGNVDSEISSNEDIHVYTMRHRQNYLAPCFSCPSDGSY
jgi:hypothetical protein